MSLAAYLIPVAVPVSYEKDPDAGAAKPLREAAGCCHCWRTARCVCRPRAERDNMMIGPRAAGGFSGERCRMERCCSISNVKLHEEVIQVTVIRPNARSTPTLLLLLLALCCAARPQIQKKQHYYLRACPDDLLLPTNSLTT